MMNALLSLLLSIQLALPAQPTALPQRLHRQPNHTAHPQKIWWGLIDPELSTWFARLPMEPDSADASILWDWSWRGFLAALFSQPMTKEAGPDAVSA